MPTASGLSSFTAQVADAAGQRVSQGFTLSVAGVAITTTNLPSGTVGTIYIATLAASGGTTPYTWRVTAGQLPAGLSLDLGGALSGLPTSATSASFTVQVRDATGQAASRTLALTISSGLSITTTSLPSGTAGAPYSATLGAAGGTAPYTWSVISGQLPGGLSLSASGSVVGTPASANSSSFTVQVRDATGQTASQAFTLSISASLTITTTSLPNGTAGAAYSASFAASGGTSPYAWSVTSGQLPAGLTLSTTGTLSGMPAAATSASFAVQVTDAAGQTASRALTLSISAALSITTASLPNGAVGVAYSATLGAAGGTAPYGWSVSAGQLPAGLTLNTTGTLSGTPAASGSSSFTVQVTDAAGQHASQAFAVSIAAGLTITTTSLPNGEVAAAYSTTLGAAGGTAPYTWSVISGQLPGGLSLSAFGSVSGTPTDANSSSFTVQVRDAAGQTASQALTLSINAALTVTTTSLPGGMAGAAYGATLAASGGTSPYTWSVISGQLRAGLTLGTAGTLAGTPTAAGSASFTVQVRDAAGQTASRALTLSISEALSITTSSLPNGTVGTVYSSTLAASGGTAPYTWSIISGQLPAGLALSASGSVSGTPTTASAASFTAQARDAAGQTASRALSLSISAALSITTTSLSSGTVGTAYSATLAASGGTSPYTWSVLSGQLPAGLTLGTAGTLSGTPTAANSASFTVQVRDAAARTASRALTLSISAALSITTTTLPNGAVGTAYSATLATTGGTAPYTWSILSGQLPQGIGLTTTSGTISGTPLTGGTYNVTVQVSDASGRQASKSLNLVIIAVLAITSANPPNGTVGAAYSATLTTSGGTPPVSWAVTSGQLPSGLTLSPSGNIAGIPTVAGPYGFTIQATDSAGNRAAQACTVTISTPGGSTPTILNADLPNGTVNTAYSAVLSASGGTPPYTWSIPIGALPAGLALNSSTGVISGTATAAGWSDFLTIQVRESAGATASLPYSIIINPQTDQYGGLVGHTCSPTGFFHAEKIGDRWWLCTPSGNLWWMTSLGGASPAGGGCDGATGQCSNYPAIATSKYGDLDVHWGPQQNRRLQLWGFNSVGQLSSGYMRPVATCSGCDGWPNGEQPVKLPMTQTLLVSNYSAINLNNYGTRPTKNMRYGLNSNYTGWPASVMDFFDPEFGHWLDGYFANDAGVRVYKNSPWVLGLFLDDTDWFWGMGAGPDFHTIPPGHTNSHVGYMVLITSPMQTFNPDPANRRMPMLYSDAKVYSKAAMTSPPPTCTAATPCSLRDYLHKKYNGNIATLNQAWGSNYTTFDSSGTQVTGELVGTGDGATKVFLHTLAQTPVSPESVLIKVAGTPQAGDCPWWISGCQASNRTGTLRAAGGTQILTGEQAWLSALYAQDSAGYPSASFWAQVTYNFPPASGHVASTSRLVGETYQAGNKRPFVVSPARDAGGAATGYDVYMSCRLKLSNTPAFGCVGANDPSPAPTLQATNVPFGTDWGVPISGLLSGNPLPAQPSIITYANGQMQVTFGVAPTQGQQVTVDYVANGWMNGSGLMDEDGRHTTWVGTNSICLSPALACDGTDNPLPSANANLAADLDGWITQFAAQYFSSCRDNFKRHAPNIMYLGADTVGTWGVPPRKEILAAAAPYVDALFTTWIVGQPDAATSTSIHQYLTRYLGDKPLLNFLTPRANPDSSVFRYPFLPVFWAPTQEQRGQMYRDMLSTMLSTRSYNGTFQWIGANWWGLTDFWPSEKVNFGLVSLNDSPYDGKSATVTARRDPWGFTSGNEERNYGDATDYLKKAHSLWWYGLLTAGLP